MVDFDLTAITECIQYTEYDSEYQGFYDWCLDIIQHLNER